MRQRPPSLERTQVACFCDQLSVVGQPSSADRLLALVACTATSTAPQPAPPPIATLAPPVSPDQDFLNRVATGIGNEIQLGRLVQEIGRAAPVRAFGAHIAAEHSRAHAGLMALARQLNQVPNIAPADLSQLTALSGPDFDRRSPIRSRTSKKRLCCSRTRRRQGKTRGRAASRAGTDVAPRPGTRRERRRPVRSLERFRPSRSASCRPLTPTLAPRPRGEARTRAKRGRVRGRHDAGRP